MTPLNPSDRAKLAATEKPSLNRARASRTHRRLHVVLLVLLALAFAAGLTVSIIADNANPQFLLMLVVLSLLGLLLYLGIRLNLITRTSLPLRLLDERQREEYDTAHRVGHRITGTLLTISFVLAACITTFSPESVAFPGWLAAPLLWLLVMAHTATPSLYLAWTQPDELPDDEPVHA